MTREVIAVTPATPVAEFARVCAEDRISGAAVVTKERIHRVLVTEKRRILGIITSLDLLGHFPGGTKGMPRPRPKPKAKRK